MTLNFDRDLVDFSAKDFKWVNFSTKYIEGLLSSCSHCRIIHSSPSLRKYNNVIYTPYIRVKHDERYGCLYDEYGKRIEDSCLKEGNKYLTKDSVNYLDTGNLQFFEGKAIYLGILLGHYGHFLLESISRWWPLAERLNNFDYYLFHLPNPSILKQSWVSKLLSLAGIDKRRIIHFDKSTRVKSVIIPETSLQIGSHIFQKYRDICQHLLKPLDLENLKQTDQPIYFSRRLLNRGVRKIAGEELLEDFLLKNGFYIVHPQFLPIEEQIYLINRHRYIVGIVGSALHSLVFSLSSKTVTRTYALTE